MVTNPVKTVTPCADAKEGRSARTTKSATPVTAIRIFATSVIAPGFALYRIGTAKARFKPACRLWRKEMHKALEPGAAWRRWRMQRQNAARHFGG